MPHHCRPPEQFKKLIHLSLYALHHAWPIIDLQKPLLRINPWIKHYKTRPISLTKWCFQQLFWLFSIPKPNTPWKINMKPKIAPPPHPLLNKNNHSLPSQTLVFCVPAVNFRHLRHGESVEQTWPHMLGSKAQSQRDVVTQAAFMKPWGPRSKPRRGFSREKWVGKGTESRKSAGTNTLECKNVSFFANLCGCFCRICQLPIEIGWIVIG